MRESHAKCVRLGRSGVTVWLGAFEKVRVGVGTCACVIHML